MTFYLNGDSKNSSYHKICKSQAFENNYTQLGLTKEFVDKWKIKTYLSSKTQHKKRWKTRFNEVKKEEIGLISLNGAQIRMKYRCNKMEEEA